jgi:hypothetical protein
MKAGIITNFLFPLHQFFEMQEYRFFSHSKFTKEVFVGKDREVTC